MSLEKGYINQEMRNTKILEFKNTDNEVKVSCNNEVIGSLNLESESIDELSKIHDFILANIIEFDLSFQYIGGSDEETVQYKVIEKIVSSFEKEYEEIKDDLEKRNISA